MLEIHGKNETIWNVTFSTWGPNTVDYDLVAQHYRSPDNIYVTPIYNSSILALSTDGRKKPAQWVGQIPNVAISVFDVFRPRHDSDYHPDVDHSAKNNQESVDADGDSMIILPQPPHYKHMDIDPKLAASVFVQQTQGGHWYAMSGGSYPSLVYSAPIAPWCSDHKKQPLTDLNHSQYLSSLIGVHPLNKPKNQEEFDLHPLGPQPQPQVSYHSDDILAIDGPMSDDRERSYNQNPRYPNRNHYHYNNNRNNPYKNSNRVQRSPSEVSRSPPPAALPPPSPPSIGYKPSSQDSEFGLYRSVVRIIENVFAFGIFFGVLAAAIRMGWLPQIVHLVEMLQPGSSSARTVEEESEKGGSNKPAEKSDSETDIIKTNEIIEKRHSEEIDRSIEKSNNTTIDSETLTDEKDILTPTNSTHSDGKLVDSDIPKLLPENIVDTPKKPQKKVEIIEPEIGGSETPTTAGSVTASPGSGDALSPNATTSRRRKRGSRGGRNSKNKKKLLLAMEADGILPEDSIDGSFAPESAEASMMEIPESGTATPTPNTDSSTTTLTNSHGIVLTRENSQIQLSGLSDNVTVIDTAVTTPISQESTPFPIQPSPLTVSDKVLGYGSHGTVVLKGEFEDREVAVKRMLLEFYDVASHEVSLLQESDDHPNVIRYYCKQQSERFLYIALELCPGTLEDLIEKPPAALNHLADMVTSKQIMFQIASGVQHLHSLKIVHRDLKPQNILVAPPKVLPGKKSKNGPVRMLISDFGLCKRLEGEQSSFRTTTAQAAGTSGWRAPELLVDDPENTLYGLRRDGDDSTDGTLATRTGSSSEPIVIDTLSNRRATRAIDIFSLGCVFFYILSGGLHPFGDKILREANIVQNNFSLDYLNERYQEDAVEARVLISEMICRDPRKRPDAQAVLLHPLFWNSAKRLDFLLKVSDRFEGESRDPPTPLLQTFERNAALVVGEDWHPKLGQLFVDNLGKYRKYHGDRILDLLRAMRNKSHHFNDMPKELKEQMSPYPDGYLKYFTERFPYLLMTIYKVVKEHLAEEDVFRPFFTPEE